MKLHKVEIIAILVAGASIAAIEQRLADSGQLELEKLTAKVLLAILAFGLVSLSSSRWGRKIPGALERVCIAVLGSTIYVTVASIYDGSSDYVFRHSELSFGLREFLQEWCRFLSIRLLILVPLNSFAYLVIYSALRFLFCKVTKRTPKLV